MDEENDKYVGMVNERARKVWRFSSNEFWKNVGCLVLDTTFGLGGLRLCEKEEAQETSENNIKIHSIRVKVDLYEVCLSYIIYFIIFIL